MESETGHDPELYEFFVTVRTTQITNYRVWAENYEDARHIYDMSRDKLLSVESAFYLPQEISVTELGEGG